MVGAALIFRNGTTDEYIQSPQDFNGAIAFISDHLSKEAERIGGL